MASKRFLGMLRDYVEYYGPMTTEDWLKELRQELGKDAVSGDEVETSLRELNAPESARMLWMLALLGCRAALPFALARLDEPAEERLFTAAAAACLGAKEGFEALERLREDSKKYPDDETRSVPIGWIDEMLREISAGKR